MGDGGRPSKIERVIQEYGLDAIRAELEARWLGKAGNRQSLRELAEWFNRQVIGAAIAREGRAPSDEEIEALYRALTGDLDAAEEMRHLRKLDQIGLAKDRLRADLVSHQTIYTYLSEERGVAYEEVDDDTRISNAIETIQRLQGRTEAVATRTVEQLRDTGRIDIGPIDALLELRITCQDCGYDYEIVELLRQGNCQCMD